MERQQDRYDTRENAFPDYYEERDIRREPRIVREDGHRPLKKRQRHGIAQTPSKRPQNVRQLHPAQEPETAGRTLQEKQRRPTAQRPAKRPKKERKKLTFLGVIHFFLLGVILLILGAVAAVLIFYLANRKFHFLTDYKYSDSDFGIETYVSNNDADGDGIDDQTDILESARAYLATKPEYMSKIYEGGYPDDGYGVCTDVVGFAMAGAGYDLRTLVNEDILADPDGYGIDTPEIDIDFRRVPNLYVYFGKHAASLTTDVTDISQWQGGDIVVYKHHIGIISDKRDKDGVPYVLHHGREGQTVYEQDILRDGSVIIAHFRVG